MKLINRENGEELVEVGSHKDYASKGVAGAGLGLGIAGTALWLLSGGLGGGLFGNRFGAAGAAALGAESTVEKEDKCELVNGMWQLAFNGQNAPYSFNFKYDPILENPFRSEIDYNKEIDERVRQLQLMKDKYNSTVKQTTQSESLWNKIDNEIKSLNDDQRNILFNDKNYISIDTQLKILVQEALVNSVKNVIENSEIGNKLLTQQLNLIKTNKDKIIAESNRELETFKKFQIAAQANPNLTYKEFCENINNK